MRKGMVMLLEAGLRSFESLKEFENIFSRISLVARKSNSGWGTQSWPPPSCMSCVQNTPLSLRSISYCNEVDCAHLKEVINSVASWTNAFSSSLDVLVIS